MSTTALTVDSRVRAPCPEQGVLELAFEEGEFFGYRSGGAAGTIRARSLLVVTQRLENPWAPAS